VVCVVAILLEARLVHVCVGVLGPVRVGVSVLVLDMLVVVRRVRVRMRNAAVFVFVCMYTLMGVLVGHCQSSPLRETYCAAWL
jgi:hypothetical protein